MVAREGLWLTSLGLITGVVVGLVAARALRGLLYGVPPIDPPTLISVTALFAVVALIACLRPAWTAGRVDPVKTLRTE